MHKQVVTMQCGKCMASCPGAASIEPVMTGVPEEVEEGFLAPKGANPYSQLLCVKNSFQENNSH